MRLDLILLAFCGLWLAALLLHWLENRRLTHDLSRLILPHGYERRIVRMLWGRTLQILLVLAACGGLGGALVWKLQQVQAEREIQQQLPASEPPAADVKAPPVTLWQHEEAPQESAGASSPSSPDVTVGQVFTGATPEAAVSDRLDEIKQRYESLFVNYLFLRRCGGAEATDYHVISSALLEELASLDGPSRMHADVLTAARGSYDEVYARIPCDPAKTQALAQQFRAYVDSLKEQGVP